MAASKATWWTASTPRPASRSACTTNTCLVENTDTLFATDSAKLTADGRRAAASSSSQSAGAFGYAIYGHTDSRASDEYNMGLSQRRAAAVAAVARSVGAVVERQIGFGERQPGCLQFDGGRHAEEPSRRSRLLPVVIKMIEACKTPGCCACCCFRAGRLRRRA